MRYLLISITVLLVGCASYPKKQKLAVLDTGKQALSIPYFSNPETDYVYKAGIDVFDNHFSGLLIVKKTDENTHRVVFTTEMGSKIFDFSFQGNLFTINYIQDDLNRKLLLKILEQDFRTLVCENPTIAKGYTLENNSVLEGNINGETHYFYLDGTGQLVKTVFPKKGKASITYSFSKINSDIAREIIINHQSFNLKIILKSI